MYREIRKKIQIETQEPVLYNTADQTTNLQTTSEARFTLGAPCDATLYTRLTSAETQRMRVQCEGNRPECSKFSFSPNTRAVAIGTRMQLLHQLEFTLTAASVRLHTASLQKPRNAASASVAVFSDAASLGVVQGRCAR